MNLTRAGGVRRLATGLLFTLSACSLPACSSDTPLARDRDAAALDGGAPMERKVDGMESNASLDASRDLRPAADQTTASDGATVADGHGDAGSRADTSRDVVGADGALSDAGARADGSVAGFRPTIVVRDGTFRWRATGEVFKPTGFNYIRLNNPAGGNHTTFSPEGYDPKRAEAMLARIAPLGFNTVRVFVSTVGHVPGSLTYKTPDKTYSPAYMANLSDFLARARRHGVFVLAEIELLPAHQYSELTSGAPADWTTSNRLYLHAGTVQASAQFLGDFLSALRQSAGSALGALLGIDLQNECSYDVTPPLTATSGTLKAPNGKSYDLSSQTAKVKLLDDAAIHWIDRMTTAIHAQIPELPVAVSVFTYRAVGRTGVGDLHPEAAAWKNRIPFRPVAIAKSTANVIDVHLYPATASELTAHLRSIAFDELRPAMTAAGMALQTGEFGVFAKAPFADIAAAAAWSAELARLLDTTGFVSRLFWTYDSHEDQPGLWSALSGDASILDALAKAMK